MFPTKITILSEHIESNNQEIVNIKDLYLTKKRSTFFDILMTFKFRALQ